MTLNECKPRLIDDPARALRRLARRLSDSLLGRSDRRFCVAPFRDFHIMVKGESFTCCPTWLPTPMGNLSEQPLEEIWNGEKARAIRASIHDDSFRYCDAGQCPHLRNMTGPVSMVSEVEDEELKAVIAEKKTVLARGPGYINCSFERSCNLSCPSCRTEVIVETGERDRILAIQRKIEDELFRDGDTLVITGSGDPFASPFFRDWLQSLKKEGLGGIRNIHLMTNGLLWTPGAWDALPPHVRALINVAVISIDAASPELYAVNRRGGSFEKLLENLDFICGLRRSGPLTDLTIAMTVQANNFREMPDFVRLGKRLGVDHVYFNKISDWGTFSPEEFERRAVHRTSHPDFSELGRVLEDPIFRDPIARLGSLRPV